ncbi:hypothetical protein Tco_0684657 [Tanacetum coccineum]
MIYENNKKEKRVMILKEVPKFCDATLKMVLEMLKKYNKDVKYGYADPSPSDADARYLQFYEEYIKERLKNHDQIRRWEIYVNGRPLGRVIVLRPLSMAYFLSLLIVNRIGVNTVFLTSLKFIKLQVLKKLSDMIEEKIKNTKGVRLRGLDERKEMKECLQEVGNTKAKGG